MLEYDPEEVYHFLYTVGNYAVGLRDPLCYRYYYDSVRLSVTVWPPDARSGKVDVVSV
jgi:hypothetical protein